MTGAELAAKVLRSTMICGTPPELISIPILDYCELIDDDGIPPCIINDLSGNDKMFMDIKLIVHDLKPDVFLP